jgi:hypothetical protein
VFRLGLTSPYAYKLTIFLPDHVSHYENLDGSLCIAEYIDIADVVQYDVRLMAQTDHKPHKASLLFVLDVVFLG